MKILILVFFLFSSLYSQSIKLVFKDTDDNKALEDVLVYSDNNFLGKSDGKGEIPLEIKSFPLYIVRIGYDDIVIKDFMEHKIYLNKIKSLRLDDVVVKNLSKQSLLDSIYKKIEKNKYMHPQFYQFVNILSKDKDILHSINNRMAFISNDGFYLEEKIKSIKNYKIWEKEDNIQLVYSLNGQKITFKEVAVLGYPMINYEMEFSELVKNFKNYEFNIISDDNFSKIIFKSKKGYNYYEGYIIYDFVDYGIYEFSGKFGYNKVNIDERILESKTTQSYNTIQKSYFIKYDKIDNNYIFNSSNLKHQFIQTKGNFKNSIFFKVVNTEKTNPFNITSSKKIDLLTFE